MTKIKIYNKLGRSFSLDRSLIRDSIIEDLNKIDLTNNYEIEIIFTDTEEIKELNSKFRKIDKPTDVLSFPIEQFNTQKKILGSLVISPEIVSQKDESIEEVIKHGILHLLGYDHETDLPTWEEAAKIINCEY